jgi:hypothetical protein
MMRVLSLGWGVQSWTLAAMVALGELPPVDFAIHADTGYEAEGTYSHAAKWTPWLAERGVKVVTVRGPRNEVVMTHNVAAVMIPAFTVDQATGKRGQVRRQCTSDWKIQPIRRFVRTLMAPRPRPGSVTMIQGISLDELTRMRTSDVKYITNEYPLVDARITRAGCTHWLESHGLDVPVKSACTFCPYHSIGHWKESKREGGHNWRQAVAVDKIIRDRRPKHGPLFIHPARVPLADAVNIPEDHGARQMALEEAPCDGGVCFV